MWSSSSSSLLSSATTTTTTRTKSKTTSVLVPQKRGRRRRRPFVHVVENKNRIAFTKLELSENESSTVVVRLRQSDERFEHLRQVLKKTNKGDEFKATILNERLATGRILSYDDDDDDERSVLIEILSTKEEEAKEEKMVTVSLILAMPRPWGSSSCRTRTPSSRLAKVCRLLSVGW